MLYNSSIKKIHEIKTKNRGGDFKNEEKMLRDSQKKNNKKAQDHKKEDNENKKKIEERSSLRGSAFLGFSQWRIGFALDRIFISAILEIIIMQSNLSGIFFYFWFYNRLLPA